MYHLAQINIARIRFSLDDPRMADFVTNLARINQLAEDSAGFVWRLKDDTGNATSVKAFDDPRIILNVTVWESIEALKGYVYKSEHTPYIGRRAEWFDKLDMPHLALWWIRAGHIPTPAEGKERLDHMSAHGVSEFAFTFTKPFPAPVTVEG
jgi:hypothetical protein